MCMARGGQSRLVWCASLLCLHLLRTNPDRGLLRLKPPPPACTVHMSGAKSRLLMVLAGAAAELGGVTGAWAAVRYLTAIGAPETDLIKHHAR